ncbi:SDR family oxidoreductase [Ferrimonas sediminicola]|uniref:SDR family oxidoreductase n=1 Tax=Ferrimonas sediminicola TaxID=2569538 RepID=A0A4U1BE84_9GAMM|nr:SDR family oxidoreductase [Ferrimonas sediminicola]TKB49453.1 SDR family oxidoreductase [Ferrimonas sediminicola]
MANLTLITGANRGIGLEFCRQYLRHGDTVIACCRHPEQAETLQQLAEQYPSQLELVALELAEPAQFDSLSAYLGERTLDRLILNAGVYGPKGLAFGEYQPEHFELVMRINVAAPMLLTQALAANLGQGSKLALLSSKMGSITDNGSGGSYAYRASKSALNAVGKSLAIDLQARGVAVALLHPGWVQTDMGGPNAWITAEVSVRGMRHVIEQLTLVDSGTFYNYDGTELPW